MQPPGSLFISLLLWWLAKKQPSWPVKQNELISVLWRVLRWLAILAFASDQGCHPMSTRLGWKKFQPNAFIHAQLPYALHTHGARGEYLHQDFYGPSAF